MESNRTDTAKVEGNSEIDFEFIAGFLTEYCQTCEEAPDKAALNPESRVLDILIKAGCESDINGVDVTAAEMCLDLEKNLEEKYNLPPDSIAIDDTKLSDSFTLEELLVCVREAVAKATA